MGQEEEEKPCRALVQGKGPVWAEARMYFCCAFAIPRLKPGVIRIGSFVEWRFAPRFSVWQEEKEENSFLGALGQRKGPVWAEARMYFCWAFAIPRLKPGVIRIGSFVEWRFAPRFSVWQEEKEENSFLGALGQRKGPVWAEARTLIKKRLSPQAKACGNARLKEFANQKKLL